MERFLITMPWVLLLALSAYAAEGKEKWYGPWTNKEPPEDFLTEAVKLKPGRNPDPGHVFLIRKAGRAAVREKFADSLSNLCLKAYPQKSVWYRNRASNARVRGKPEHAGDLAAAGAITCPNASNLWLEAYIYYKNAWNLKAAAAAVLEFARETPGQEPLAVQRLNELEQKDSTALSALDTLFSYFRHSEILRFRFHWNLFRGNYNQAWTLLSAKSPEPLADSLRLRLLTETLINGKTGIAEKLIAEKKKTGKELPREWLKAEAGMLLHAGNIQEAEKIYESVLDRTGDIEPTLDICAFFLYDAHKPSKAVAILDQLRNRKGNYEYVHRLNTLSTAALIMLGRYEDARANLVQWRKSTAAQAEKLSDIAFYQGMVEAAQNRMDKAAVQWRKVLNNKKGRRVNDAIFLSNLFKELDPEPLQAYWRFYMRAFRGEYAAAADSLKTFSVNYYGELRSGLLVNTADWYGKGRLPQKAAQLLEKELETCPACERVHITLARIHAGPLNNRRKAAEICKAFLLNHPNSIFRPEARAIILSEKRIVNSE